MKKMISISKHRFVLKRQCQQEKFSIFYRVRKQYIKQIGIVDKQQKMNYLKQSYSSLLKKTKHYWNPNQNPTQLDKYAFNLLDKGEVDTFIQFMEENPVNLNVVGFKNTSLLIKAQGIVALTNPYRKLVPEQELEKRAIKACRYLLDRGVDINYQDKNGYTALLTACHWQHYSIAEFLLQNRADPNIGSNSANFYTTPLLSAMFKNDMEIVTLLLEYKADPLKTIEANRDGASLNLTQAQLDFLHRCDNIVKLTTRRFFQRKKDVKTVISTCSEAVFQDFCMNV